MGKPSHGTILTGDIEPIIYGIQVSTTDGKMEFGINYHSPTKKQKP